MPSDSWYELGHNLTPTYVSVKPVGDRHYLSRDLWRSGVITAPVEYEEFEGNVWGDSVRCSLLTPLLVSERFRNVLEECLDEPPTFVPIEVVDGDPPSPLYAICSIREVDWIRGKPREKLSETNSHYIETDMHTISPEIAGRRAMVVLRGTIIHAVSRDVAEKLLSALDKSVVLTPFSEESKYASRSVLEAEGWT